MQTTPNSRQRGGSRPRKRVGSVPSTSGWAARRGGETERYTQAESDEQPLWDLIKAGICLYRGTHLVIIHTEDLSLERTRKKVGQILPLRDLAED